MSAALPVAAAGALLPALALTLNAFVWGTSWWPLRALQSHGMHPLWSTVFIYTLAVLAIGSIRPYAFVHLVRTPALWVLAIASGITNAAFNWAIVIGDVVRVVLLFYLMPLWAVLLARLLLNEPLTRTAVLRVLLALAGAVIVLWPEGRTGWDAVPLPRTLPDWLGIAGGFGFALNNVMLRREAHRPNEARALAMFVGGASVAFLLASTLALQSQLSWPADVTQGWLPLATGLAVLFLMSNMALQYGAARLPANVSAVVMLSEVVFASTSAVVWGDASLTLPLVAGGGLIVLAAVLASRRGTH